jgi:hypothetical protein
MLALLATAALATSPALAAKKSHTVSCKQIKEALDSGKSAEDVAKDMKVKESRVKAIAKDGCTTTKHTKKGTMHPS